MGFSGCASFAPSPGGAIGSSSGSSSPRAVLDIPDLEHRALLLLVADRREYEPVALNTALERGPEVRRLAALAFGRVGDPRGVPSLQSLLADSDPSVRRATAFALGEIGERGHEDAARALLSALTDPDRQTGRLAVEGLAKSGVVLESVVEKLIAGDPEEFFPRLLPDLFRFQVVAKGRGETSPAVVRWAVAYLEQNEPPPMAKLRARAAYALAREPLSEALPKLRELLADPDPWVRGWAARALGSIGERSDLDRLRPLLDDGAPGPIIQALRAARRLIDSGLIAPPESWRSRLLELLDDPRPGVRLTAIEHSAPFLLDEALGNRLALFVERGEAREKGLALLSLALGQDERAMLGVVALAKASDPDLRAAVAEPAALLGATKILDQLTVDPHPKVRSAALVTWLLGDSEGSLSRLEQALMDTDPGVRATALEWAIEQPLLSKDFLLGALGRARRERMIELKVAAVRAIAARAEAEPLERGALVAVLEELAEGGPGSDYVTRRQAIAALNDLGREPPALGAVDSRKSLELYRDVVRRTSSPRQVRVETDRGVFTIELACGEAPLTCLNFLQLANQGFYDGSSFHRVVPDFVAQAGDPRGDGRGGPGYTIRDEMNPLRYERGSVGMALSGPDTGGSQFFVVLSPQPHLDGGYTLFGRVIEGMNAVDLLLQGDLIQKISER